MVTWLLAVSSFECTKSVFNITDENNSFSITIPSHWQTKSDEKTIDKQNKLSELRSLELHVKEEEVRKRGNKKKETMNINNQTLILKKRDT